MSVISEAVLRLDDDSMKVAVRDSDDARDIFFMSDGFACQVQLEGPEADAMEGNREYELLARAYESGNLEEVDFSEVDMDALHEQLEESRADFPQDELDLENATFEMDEEPQRVSKFELEDDFELELA